MPRCDPEACQSVAYVCLGFGALQMIYSQSATTLEENCGDCVCRHRNRLLQTYALLHSSPPLMPMCPVFCEGGITVEDHDAPSRSTKRGSDYTSIPIAGGSASVISRVDEHPALLLRELPGYVGLRHARCGREDQDQLHIKQSGGRCGRTNLGRAQYAEAT